MFNISLPGKTKINCFTLSFEKSKEVCFQRDYFKNSLKHSRIALLIGLFFYAIFGFLDAVLVPEAKFKLWLIRYVIIFPYVLGVLLFSFSKKFEKSMQFSLSSSLLIAGVGIIAMILIAPPPANYSYYAGLMLVFIYGYSFLKLRFVWASATCWLLVFAYEISAIWVHNTPIPTLINNNFFFLSGNVLGMAACYSIELYTRKNYIQSNLLDIERQKVINANIELEDRVFERTSQLLKTNSELEREIKERKNVESALRESEEKYRILVNHGETAIFIAQDGVIKFPNPMTLELTKCTSIELASMPFSKFVHPKHKHMVLERHRRRLRGEDPPNSYDFQMIDKNGRELWCHLNAVLIKWEGRPATLNFLRDINDQKLLEDKLQQSQKMEAIGTLAGGVAHDLNNVLSGVVSYPELLLMDLPENSPLKKPIQTIQESGKRAAAIVQDLLTLARRGVSVSEVVDLNHIITQYLNSLEFKNLMASHSDIKIETNFESNLFNLLGSPVHLTKTIMNLISNAVEVLPDGGKITIKTKTCYLDEPRYGYETINEGEYVCVSIKDTGSGISQNDINKIFEPFYTKKVMGISGSGLGMSVVWGTVKDHNGYIDIESYINNGTKFTLFFPVVRKEISKHEPEPRIQEFMGYGEKILIVDDVEEQRFIASGILKKLGYIVRTVNSGEEAIKYLEKNFVDLVILDMIMDPGIDGLETYKEILKLNPQQKAIIASGYSESIKVKEALKIGAYCYIKKPYTIEKFGISVRSAINEKKIENDLNGSYSQIKSEFQINKNSISNTVH